MKLNLLKGSYVAWKYFQGAKQNLHVFIHSYICGTVSPSGASGTTWLGSYVLHLKLLLVRSWEKTGC